jgi:hypothetical protein
MTYTTETGWSFGVNSETTANWEAEGEEQWTAPIIFGASKVVRLGRRPLSVGGYYGYYAAKPTGAPAWRIRAVITLLFPK